MRIPYVISQLEGGLFKTDYNRYEITEGEFSNEKGSVYEEYKRLLTVLAEFLNLPYKEVKEDYKAVRNDDKFLDFDESQKHFIPDEKDKNKIREFNEILAVLEILGNEEKYTRSDEENEENEEE